MSKRHMRRIVRKELLETLLVNHKLIKINEKSQTKTAFQSATQKGNRNEINIEQKGNRNEINIEQFTQTENQCTAAFPIEIDEAESIRYIEMLVEDDFQLHKCNVEFDNKVSSATEEFVLDATKPWVLKYRHLLSQRAINNLLQILRVPHIQSFLQTCVFF